MNAEFRRLIFAGLICFCAGGLYGWSALISPLQQAFSVTTADAGFVFSIAIASFTIAVLSTPYLPAFFRNSRGLGFLGIIASVWLIVSSIASNFVMFVIFFGVGFGATSGAIYMVALGIAADTNKPGIFTPVMVASFGLGGAVFGPLWRVIGTPEIGLLVILILPMLFILASIISLVFSVQPPIESTAKTGNSVHQSPMGQPMHVVVLLWVLFAFGSVGGLMVLGLASKMLDFAGSSVFMASIALAGIAIANTSGRLSVAGFNRYYNPISVSAFAATIGAIGLLIATQFNSAEVIAIVLTLIALGYGGMASAVPSIASTIFGQYNFARLFPIIFTAWGVAGLSAPWIAGAIFDATGNFSGAIYTALCANLLAILIAIVLRKIAA